MKVQSYFLIYMPIMSVCYVNVCKLISCTCFPPKTV